MNVGRVVIEKFEEVKSFGSVVPETFEDLVNKFGCPLDWECV